MLPNYIDAQFKVKTRLGPHDEITFLGLAGFDNMRLNNEPDDEGDEYLLSYLPVLKQETFTAGAVYKHFSEKHIQTLTLSYNYLNNRSHKYLGNDDSDPSDLILRSSGLEGKAQARFENRSYIASWTLRSGADMSWRHYDSDVYRAAYGGAPAEYDSNIGFLSWGLYGSADYKSPEGKINASFGLRTDGASFSRNTARFWKQMSPRASVSYMPWEAWSFNASAGLYHQLPPMTALSFRDSEGVLVNRGLDYMRVFSAAAGADWKLRDRLFIGLEGFYKRFMDIPLSVATDVPLTCIGADYGAIGEELLVLPSSYGITPSGDEKRSIICRIPAARRALPRLPLSPILPTVRTTFADGWKTSWADARNSIVKSRGKCIAPVEDPARIIQTASQVADPCTFR